MPGALGKSLVVFWEGQRLARTLARKGLVRRQAEERGGGQVRRPARVCQASGNTARQMYEARQVKEPCKNPKEESKQTPRTFISSSPGREL